MHITLHTMSGELLAQVPITTDKHGYLYATHPTFYVEVEIALYGYQEGQVNSDTIDDCDTDTPYMQWHVHA